MEIHHDREADQTGPVRGRVLRPTLRQPRHRDRDPHMVGSTGSASTRQGPDAVAPVRSLEDEDLNAGTRRGGAQSAEAALCSFEPKLTRRHDVLGIVLAPALDGAEHRRRPRFSSPCDYARLRGEYAALRVARDRRPERDRRGSGGRAPTALRSSTASRRRSHRVLSMAHRALSLLLNRRHSPPTSVCSNRCLRAVARRTTWRCCGCLPRGSLFQDPVKADGNDVTAERGALRGEGPEAATLVAAALGWSFRSRSSSALGLQARGACWPIGRAHWRRHRRARVPTSKPR